MIYKTPSPGLNATYDCTPQPPVPLLLRTHTIGMPTLRSRDEVPITLHDVSQAQLAHPSTVGVNLFARQVDNGFTATTSASVKGKRVLRVRYTALQKKRREFRWTDECQAAFDELRVRLSTAPILMLPNTTETAPPFALDTDASAFAMGGVLSQVDDNGLERVFCFANKTLIKPQRNYCTFRCELLAIVTFVKQFRPYLLGKPFVFRSDHKALQWLQNTKDAEGHLARWQKMLQEYHFACTYRPGKQHSNADALSRRPATSDARDENLATGETNAIYASEPARHHWAIAQSTDPDTAVVYDHLLHRRHRPTDDELRGSSEEAHILRSQWSRLHIDEDILPIKDEITKTDRVVVPGSLVHMVLTDLHNELGHVGQTKTEAATRQRFWWPHLREHVATFCNTCTTCAKFKAP
ncbi:hypothetical protein SprV_0501857400 [Sparganum proliferum]